MPVPTNEAWPPPPPPAPSHRGRKALAAILAGLLLLGGGVGIGWRLSRTTDTPSAARAPISVLPGGDSAGSDGALSLRAIQEKVDPAVVDVNIVIGTAGALGGSNRQAAGTGMILTSSGQVLTNNHVIDGATTIGITIQGRSGTFTATPIGADPSDDVALLQLQGVSGLPTVTLGDSSGLSTGQRVVAIGNALGRGGPPTATTGVVTALNRSITAGGDGSSPEHLSGLIETNAPISPGDSGGPLVDSSGRVIGMITAAERAGRRIATSHVGFAISSNSAVGIVNRIRSGESSSTIILGQPGMLGVEVQNLDQVTANQLGLSVSSGALVVGVVPGGPAAQAGIARPAVITAVNGEAIRSADVLAPAIQTHKPGEQIRVTWVDRSGTHSATVTLVPGPAA